MWPYKECLTLISLLICRPDEHGQKTRSAATRRWRLSVLTAETLFLVVVIRDKCLQSPQSPVMSPPRWLTPMTTCLFEADFSARPAPPQTRPAQLRPVSYLFSKPTSKLETKLRLISTDLVCSGYFVIFSKPEIGEAVNIWFCWELKSTSTNLTVPDQRVVELCWWPKLALEV